jgi:hypothetical protein
LLDLLPDVYEVDRLQGEFEYGELLGELVQEDGAQQPDEEDLPEEDEDGVEHYGQLGGPGELEHDDVPLLIVEYVESRHEG